MTRVREIVLRLLGAPGAPRGESGTLTMTRPDVSIEVRFSKEESLRRGVAEPAARM